MKRRTKIGLAILAGIGFVVIVIQQRWLMHKQRELERRMERSPFYEPGTNSDKTTTP